MAKKITITVCSDLHGNLPKGRIPECDLLLLAGDIAPWSRGWSVFNQANWYNAQFEPWIKSQPAKQWYAVFGNHCFVGENNPHLLSQYLQDRFLTDRSASAFGLNIHGSPWQLPFHDWAFNLPEERLEQRWAAIPDDTNILLCHGPANQICDFSPWDGGHHCGSETLLKRLYELESLKLYFFGHIHFCQNKYDIIRPDNPIVCANVSLLNEAYKMTGKPTIVEIILDEGKIEVEKIENSIKV